ncbi:expressed unknown protein [Seminavis robusta]|uniref:Uncharacterized protein n=1 Tax=Seminavis robusta TaxID=568900 RepID=A0A9N8HZP9_9STRA|nr:expressed unknown protein [Seminavis robusta]|eukprot:Sro3935_g351980.1 n/a (156) ;mRNA; f:2616-3083
MASTTTTTQPLVSAMKSNNSEDRRRRRVCFGDLEIHEFPLIMGDNPHCDGAPLQLSWKPSNESVVDIDFYEYTRDPRRSKKKMHMAGVDREIYLLSIGYSLDEVLDCAEKGKKTRKERYSSFQNKKWDRFHVVMESAREKLRPGAQHHIVSAKTA